MLKNNNNSYKPTNFLNSHAQKQAKSPMMHPGLTKTPGVFDLACNLQSASYFFPHQVGPAVTRVPFVLIKGQITNLAYPTIKKKYKTNRQSRCGSIPPCSD